MVPENASRVLGYRFLPLGDLHRANVEFLSNFLDGFDALDLFKHHVALNSGACLLSLPLMLCVFGKVLSLSSD